MTGFFIRETLVVKGYALNIMQTVFKVVHKATMTTLTDAVVVNFIVNFEPTQLNNNLVLLLLILIRYLPTQ